ncbi:ankyrin repeat-containing domain protein, partial [Halenospora varia]
LYWAAHGGHMNMVQKLVEQGADVNGYGSGSNDQNGLTALHGAAESDSIEIVEYLLANGAHIDVIDEDNGTALYAAIEAESIPIIQLLLNKGASPNSIGGDESTPLNCAAGIGNLEIVQLLLARGAELNPDMTYRLANALGAAAYQGHDDVAKYLLERGCHTNQADFQGEFPLALAAQEGYEEIVALILEYDREPQSHDQALDCAVKANELECVKVLIERCPMVLRSDPFAYAASNGFSEILKVLTNTGVTSQVMDKCLYEATDYQHIETVEVLLQMGANPDAEGEEFGNALQAAAFDGTEEIIRLLLDAHANPNRVYGDDTYGTALQAAAYEGTLSNVELLVERGAKINASQCGKYGSALQAACHADSRDVVQYLLAKGVNPNVRGGPLTYPIIAATNFGYGTIVEYLVAAGADVNVKNEEDNGSALINAAMELPLAIIQLLIERGANIHDVDNDGDNALTAAAAAGDGETLVYLMDKGADIQRIGKYGGALYRSVGFGAEGCMGRLLERGINVNQEGGPMHTTLQVACSLGNLETVELLLEHKANVNITGGTFHTALQAAVSVENVEIVQRLLDNGAKVNAHGGRHGSALHAAVRMKNQELIDLLLEHEADINAIDDYTGSILTLACRRASTDVVTHLIEKGADVKVRGGKYDTALQASCYCEAIDEVKMLLEHGADPTIEGGYYKSAFGAAASRDSVELMEVLLAQDKELPAQMLVEALYTAVHFRKPDAVKFLLDKCPNISAKSTQYDSLMEA